MPKKIDFGIIHVTSKYHEGGAVFSVVFPGEDPKHRATELNSHGPTVKGWQSSKNCDYPQEVVIQLNERCSLNKIQILAHQYLIRNEEIFFGN